MFLPLNHFVKNFKQIIVAALFYIGGGWYFSNLIDARALDGAARREDFAHPTYDLTVTAIASN